MTRKKTWLGLALILIALTVLLVFFSGAMIKPLLELAIRNNGFPNAHIETVTVIPNGLLLENISLDGDSFSSIEAAQVTTSITDLVLKKKIENVEFKNIELSGEIDEKGQYIIAGWNASLASDEPSDSPSFLIENIAMNGLTLDFETPEGAIRIEGKLALHSAADKTRDFQANLWGKQKQLSLNATAIGKITPDGQWNADIELLEGRLDMDAIKATRASGSVKLNSVANGISYQGKMMAGGVRLNDIPFQDLEVAFDATKPEILNLTTSPTGHDGIVLTGLLLNKSPLTVELIAEIKDLNDLGTLLEIKRDDLSWLTNTDPLKLTLTAPLSGLLQPQIITQWKLIAGANGKLLQGSAQYDREKQTLSGILSQADISGVELSQLLPLKEKNEILLKEGALKLDGAFSANLAESPLKVDGALTADAKNIGGTWQDYPFNKVSGVIKLNQLLPWSIDKNQAISIGTIGTGVNLTNGSIVFDGNAAQGVSVRKMNFSMAEGTLSASPFTWKPDAKENLVTVNLQNISLQALAANVAANGFTAEGALNGSLPLAFTSKGLVFKEGQIASVGAGRFKYAPAAFPAALQGDDTRMNTVRQALSDFNFTSLQISIHGDLENSLTTTLKASGKNPVFSDRVINLNINLEGALVPALQQALQPGRIADSIEKSVTGE